MKMLLASKLLLLHMTQLRVIVQTFGNENLRRWHNPRQDTSNFGFSFSVAMGFSCLLDFLFLYPCSVQIWSLTQFLLFDFSHLKFSLNQQDDQQTEKMHWRVDLARSAVNCHILQGAKLEPWGHYQDQWWNTPVLISVDHVFLFLHPVIFIQTIFFTSTPLWFLFRPRFFKMLHQECYCDKHFKAIHTPVVFIWTTFFRYCPMRLL